MKTTTRQSARDTLRRSSRTVQHTLELGLLVILGGIPALAQQNTGANNGVPRLYAYAAFLDTHADVASAIDALPALVPGAGTLQQYPELSAFLEQHIDIENELSTNTSTFQSLEERFLALQPSGLPVHRLTIIWFDTFLASNSQLSGQLVATPDLIDAPATLSNYLTLKNFIQNNPFFPQLFRSNTAVLIASAPGSGQ